MTTAKTTRTVSGGKGKKPIPVSVINKLYTELKKESTSEKKLSPAKAKLKKQITLSKIFRKMKKK